MLKRRKETVAAPPEQKIRGPFTSFGVRWSRESDNWFLCRDEAYAPAVDQALNRLTKASKIRQISRGIYDILKNHPTLGPLSPDPIISGGARGQRAWSQFTGNPGRSSI